MQLPKPPLVLAQGHNTGYLNKEQRMEDQEVRAKWTNETDMTVRKWNRHDCEEPGVYPWGIGTRLPSSESERAPRELNILMGINTKRDTMEIITGVIIKGENLKPSPIRELGLCDTGGAIPTEIKTGEKPCVCQITNMPTVASPAYIPILSNIIKFQVNISENILRWPRTKRSNKMQQVGRKKKIKLKLPNKGIITSTEKYDWTGENN